MGSFLVECKEKELLSKIHRWNYDEYGLRNLKEFGNTKKSNIDVQRHRLTATMSCLSLGVRVVWELQTTQDKRCFLSMKVHLTSISVIVWWSFMLAESIFYLYIVNSFFGLTNKSLDNSIENLLLGCAVASALLLLCYIWHQRVRKKLLQFERSFWDFLETQYAMRILSPIEPTLLPSWADTFTILWIIGALIYLTSWFGTLLTTFAALVYADGMLRHIWRKRTGDSHNLWKIRLLNFGETWTLLFNCIVYLALFMTLLNHVGFTFGRSEFEIRSPADLFTVKRINESFIRVTSDVEKENLQMFNALFEKRERGHFERKIVFACFLFPISISLLLYLRKSLKSFFQAPENWTNTSLFTSAGMHTPFFNEPSHGKRFSRSAIFFHCLYGALIHFIGIVLIIEGVTYVFSKRSLIFKESSVFFSWLFTASVDVLGVIAGNLYSTGLILALSFPAFFYAIGAMRRVKSALYQHFYLRKHSFAKEEQSKVGAILDFANRVCGESGLVSPRFIFVPESRFRVFIKSGLFGRQGKLYISEGVLKNLTDKELIAVVAHELGHLKNDARKIQWLSALSTIMLFPNCYLTLILDTRTFETAADRFAVSTSGDAQSLVSALVKLAVLTIGHSAEGMRETIADRLNDLGYKRVASLLNSFWNSMEFFWREEPLAYSHPPLDVRIANIKVTPV